MLVGKKENTKSEKGWEDVAGNLLCFHVGRLLFLSDCAVIVTMPANVL